jgi:hypothetical protein
MQESAGQPSNASSQICEIRQPGSNTNVARLLQYRKQHSEITSSDGGREIDRSFVQYENANEPRLRIREPDWKVKFERPVQK